LGFDANKLRFHFPLIEPDGRFSRIRRNNGPLIGPSTVVVIDTSSSHKVAGVREAIEAAGAELRYLPPYSPDLNPIELAFAKFRKLLRDSARRTVDKLWDLCGEILDAFTEPECRNYFKHCGYRYTLNGMVLD
jgi:transposase